MNNQSDRIDRYLLDIPITDFTTVVHSSEEGQSQNHHLPRQEGLHHECDLIKVHTYRPKEATDNQLLGNASPASNAMRVTARIHQVTVCLFL